MWVPIVCSFQTRQRVYSVMWIFGAWKTCGTEVQNEAMANDCSSVCYTPASWTSLLWYISTSIILYMKSCRYETTSINHCNYPSGTCFWENRMHLSKLLNHCPFTHTYFESICAAKLLSSPFTQSYSPFIPNTTGVLDWGTMRFIDPRLLNWFNSSCCILTITP